MAKKRKLLTEFEAWLLAAKWWDSAEVDKDGDYQITQSRGAHRNGLGICATILIMHDKGMIDWFTVETMDDRTKSLILNKGWGQLYAFPNTLAGARKRAAACRRFAKIAKKEEQSDEG